jgi:hypothetical protein
MDRMAQYSQPQRARTCSDRQVPSAPSGSAAALAWVQGLIALAGLAILATVALGQSVPVPDEKTTEQEAEATEPEALTQVSTLRDRLNRQLVEQAKLALDQAKLAETRAERHYQLLQRLAEKGIVPREDVQTALTDWEDQKFQARRAALNLEQTRLDLIREAIRVDVVSAQKYRTQKGELRVDVGLRNNANLSRARTVEPEKSEAELIETLGLTDVSVSLADGAIISDPYEEVVAELPYHGEVTLSFGLLADVDEVTVQTRYLDTERSLRVHLRKVATREYPTINSAQFSQEGSLGAVRPGGADLPAGRPGPSRRSHLELRGPDDGSPGQPGEVRRGDGQAEPVSGAGHPREPVARLHRPDHPVRGPGHR